VQVTNQVRVSRVDEVRGLAGEDCLRESAVEEGIFHVELLNGPGTRDSSGKHRANSDRFHNRAEGLIVVDPEALSETPKDPTGLVAIMGPVSTELVRETQLLVTTLEPWGRGTSSQVPLLIRASYSSSVAARQWGSASAARAEEGIGDGVNKGVAVARTRRLGTTLKPVLPRVIIRCRLSGGVTGTTMP
jgi:hypothetical protein